MFLLVRFRPTADIELELQLYGVLLEYEVIKPPSKKNGYQAFVNCLVIVRSAIFDSFSNFRLVGSVDAREDDECTVGAAILFAGAGPFIS